MYVNMALYLGREACRRTVLREEKEEEGENGREKGGMEEGEGEEKGPHLAEEGESNAPLNKGLSALGKERCGTKKEQQTANLIWCSVLFGLLTAVLLGALLHRTAPSAERETEWYLPCTVLFCVAICIELLTEPFYLRLQVRMLFRQRVLAEALSYLAKCWVTFLLVRLDFALLSFAMGQLVYAGCLLGIHLLYFLSSHPSSLLPSLSPRPLLSPPPTLRAVELRVADDPKAGVGAGRRLYHEVRASSSLCAFSLLSSFLSPSLLVVSFLECSSAWSIAALLSL